MQYILRLSILQVAKAFPEKPGFLSSGIHISNGWWVVVVIVEVVVVVVCVVADVVVVVVVFVAIVFMCADVVVVFVFVCSSFSYTNSLSSITSAGTPGALLGARKPKPGIPGRKR